METFLIKAIQLILSLSILVFLHELGHFLFARLFKARVDKFYMFFNPNFSILRAKKINGKWQLKFFAKNVPANEREKRGIDGDIILDSKGRAVMEQIPESELHEDDWRRYPENTEWGIGWLPLGGYCKISGMIDESMDKTQLAQEAKPWEYRSRPVWQRLPIITGGVLVNFILALVIYSAVLYNWGKEYLPLENARYGLQFSETLIQCGFRNGDKILMIDGNPVEERADIISHILIDGKKNVTVLRDSAQVEIILPEDFEKRVLAANEADMISVRYPFVIEEVTAASPAKDAGLMKGDSIVGLNNKPMSMYQDIVAELSTLANKETEIQYYRNGKLISSKIKISETSKIGVGLKLPYSYFETKKIEYGFWESIPAGISLGWETLTNYVKQFKLVFTKEGAKQIGGFGSIGKMFPNVWNWQAFWTLTATLSMVLAFMNFLPIPALDGGHVLFLLYEMITGHKPSEKFMEYAQTAGFFFLVALLIYANGNDIFRAIFK